MSGCLENFKLQLKYNLLSFPSCSMTPDCEFFAPDASSTVCLLTTQHTVQRLDQRNSLLVPSPEAKLQPSILSDTTCVLAWHPAPPVGFRDGHPAWPHWSFLRFTCKIHILSDGKTSAHIKSLHFSHSHSSFFFPFRKVYHHRCCRMVDCWPASNKRWSNWKKSSSPTRKKIVKAEIKK